MSNRSHTYEEMLEQMGFYNVHHMVADRNYIIMSSDSTL